MTAAFDQTRPWSIDTYNTTSLTSVGETERLYGIAIARSFMAMGSGGAPAAAPNNKSASVPIPMPGPPAEKRFGVWVLSVVPLADLKKTRRVSKLAQADPRRGRHMAVNLTPQYHEAEQEL